MNTLRLIIFLFVLLSPLVTAINLKSNAQKTLVSQFKNTTPTK